MTSNDETLRQWDPIVPKYKLLQTIGSGSFGVVMKAQN
jgi:hypothetical protein